MNNSFGNATENEIINCEMINHSAEKTKECGKVCSMTVTYSESPNKLNIVKNSNRDYYSKH